MGKIKKKDLKLILLSVGGAVVVFLVVWLVYSMLMPKVTYTSTEKVQTEYNAIKCTATAPDGAFFKAQQGVSTQSQIIKMTFRDGKMDKVSFQYEGKYSDEKTAEQAADNLHIDYNHYMGADAESLSPTFVAVQTEVRASVLAQRGELNGKNAKIFFLNSDEVSEVVDYPPETIEKIYEARGFSCEIDK